MSEARAYYNEHDKFAAAWLRNLIAAGHIAPGDVDERDIRDVTPPDVRGYTQCHFFAGIGVWSHALRRAGWPDRRPVWTASCPCQPFSQAGKGGGVDDERHLWPAFFHLVEQCRPRELFGEQVASKDGLAWLDLVQSDMEGTDYAFAALDLCAAGFGAPHIRQRLYWLAHTPDTRLQRRGSSETCDGRGTPRFEPERLRSISSMADDDDDGLQRGAVETVFGEGRREERDASGRSGAPLAEQRFELGDADETRERGRSEQESRASAEKQREIRVENQQRFRAVDIGASATCGLADSDGRNASAERQQRSGEQRQDGRTLSLAHAGHGQFPEPWRGTEERNGHGPNRQNTPTGPINGIWRNADWLLCRDGKWRPVRSGSFPLAHGASARMGRLRAYGNAIVAPQAEEFIGAYLEADAEQHFRLSLQGGVFA